MSIRKKLYLMLFFVLFVITGMTALAYIRDRSVIADLVDSTGMDTVKASSMAVDERFDTSISVLDTCAEVLQRNWLQKNVNEEQDIESFLKGLLSVVQRHGINNIIFGFESTGRLSDAGGWQEPEDYDARTRDWYKKGVEGKGKVTISDPYIDLEVKKPVLTLSRALYDDHGKLLGIVGGDILLDELNDYVKNIRILDKGHGFLLLKDGMLLAGLHPEDTLKVNVASDSKIPEALKKIAQRMIRGETGAQEYAYEGDEQKAFFTPVKTGFFLAVAFPVSEIRARVKDLTVLLMVIAAIALIVTAVVIVLLNRGLTRSIRSIQDTTERLGSGDLTVHYDDSAGDELA